MEVLISQVLRTQLNHMRDFILTCRDKETVMIHVGRRTHLINDIEFYSLSDFVEIAQGTLLEFALDLSEKFILHIKGCLVSEIKFLYLRMEALSRKGIYL